MAVLGKIRQYSSVVLIVIILATLGFVLQDGLGPSNRAGGGPGKEIVAEVNGEDITRPEVDRENAILLNNYILQNPGRPISDQQKGQYKRIAFSNVLNEVLLNQEYKKLGLQFTTNKDGDDNEEEDMFTNLTIPEQLASTPIFKDSSGNFDPTKFIQYEEGLKAQWANRQQGQQSCDLQRQLIQLENFKQAQVEQRRKRKYEDLITKTNYVTSYRAKKKLEEKELTADFSYLKIPFNSIVEEEVEDNLNLEKFAQKFQSKYVAREDARNIDFVKFAIVPSSEDSSKMRESLDELYKAIGASQDDSTLVFEYSDNPKNPQYYLHNELPYEVMKTLNDTLPTYGKTERIYKSPRMAKLISVYKLKDVKSDTVFTMVPRIIVLPKAQKKKAKQILDSLKNNLTSFDSLAKKHNAWLDAANAILIDSLGSLGRIRSNENFILNDFELQNELFAIKGSGVQDKILESKRYVAVVQVDTAREFQKADNKYLLATYEKMFIPSKETEDDIYSQAQDFREKTNGDFEGFTNALEQDSLIIKLNADVRKSNASYISGLPVRDESRELIKWAYEVDVKGEVSDIITVGDFYVVAVVRDEKVKGEVPQDLNSDAGLKKEALNLARANKIIDNLKALPDNSLEELAKAYNDKYGLNDTIPVLRANVMIQNNQTLENFSLRGSSEPAVVGAAFGLKPGQQSVPIVGEDGVYIIKQNELRGNASEEYTKEEINSEREEIINKDRNPPTEIYEALKQLSDIEDDSFRYF